MEPNKKYRYTRQLINMALRDGWTQKAIADACRTQQSVVSNWKNGSAHAKESQLKSLLDIYGPRMRRRSFRVYHEVRSDDQGVFTIHLMKVEGEVLLSFPYRNVELCAKCHLPASDAQNVCRCSRTIRRYMPTRRYVVHAMGNGQFCLVSQRRLIRDEVLMQFPETNIFSSQFVGQYETADLLTNVDGLCNRDNEDQELSLAEGLILQMLIRKALLEHGYPVAGVEEHLAQW